MELLSCSDIRDSLISYLRREVEIATFKDACIVTLPLKTADERFVDVTVERKLPDYFLVHDAGKSISELFTQGISLTEAIRKNLQSIAKINGAELIRDVFTVGCRADKLQDAILGIGLCSTMAMLELIGHKPEIEEEPLSSRVAKTLNAWRPPYIVGIDRGVIVRGHRYPHRLDFVAVASSDNGHPTSAIKLLPPTYSGQVQAERYAYLVLDLEQTAYESWKRVAVLTKAETWPIKALHMVRELSHATLELRTGEEPSIREQLPEKMNLVAAGLH